MNAEARILHHVDHGAPEAAPVAACACIPGGTLCTTAPVLASVTTEGAEVIIARHPRGIHTTDYAPITVNGALIGELMGTRPEGDRVTVRVRVFNGYDRLPLWRTADTFRDALEAMAPDILRAYRREYPLATVRPSDY